MFSFIASVPSKASKCIVHNSVSARKSYQSNLPLSLLQASGRGPRQ